jgi:hypothetical protein
MSSFPPPVAVDVATLPPFSNHRAVCTRCGARWEIRVHFDRGCELARGGDHYHRLCGCGHEWLERCGGALDDRGSNA